MSIVCYNCKTPLEKDVPVCPYCRVVRTDQYSREELFDYLEEFFPTRLTHKKKPVSTTKRLKTRDFWEWYSFGVLTLGIGYYLYLLVTLKDMNDHWDYPHGSYETTTKNDLFTSLLLLLTTSFFGAIIIQYNRYQKLYNHILNAPHVGSLRVPLRGKSIFWLFVLQTVLFLALVLLLFFGISSFLAGMFFEFDSIWITLLFLMGAGLILVLYLLVHVLIVIFERQWQSIFNDHIIWHMQLEEKNVSIFSPLAKKINYEK